jgi:hypothetical protein
MYSDPNSNSLIYNNLLYNNGGGGLVMRYGEAGDLVYNNTIYGNSYCGIEDSFYNRSPTGATIKNNIVFGNNGGQICTSGSPTIELNNLITDPGFVNPEAGDFRLKIGSPAIGGGVVVSGITTDIDGTIRGTVVDIGAYEYQGSSAPAPPVAPPSNLRVVLP